jgi:hypothetical protein
MFICLARIRTNALARRPDTRSNWCRRYLVLLREAPIFRRESASGPRRPGTDRAAGHSKADTSTERSSELLVGLVIDLCPRGDAPHYSRPRSGLFLLFEGCIFSVLAMSILSGYHSKDFSGSSYSFGQLRINSHHHSYDSVECCNP